MAKFGNDVGVSGHNGAEESPAARCGFHFVFGGDIVFDDQRDAVKWAADVASSSFGIEGGGDLKEVGVNLHYCTVGS